MRKTEFNPSNKKQPLYFSQVITKVFQNVYDYPLTVVVAPMGYGKTTAVRKNLAADNPILWMNVYDDSKTAFWNGFCGLFSVLDVECAESLLALGFPEDSGALQIVLVLLNQLRFRKHTFVVVDDFHLVESIATAQLISFLIVNEITNLHIVLVARYLKIVNVEEMSLKGYLLHIHKEYFKFTHKDIIQYYALWDISLTNDEAEKLYTLTEGWISALYLLVMDYKKKGKLLPSLEIYKLIGKVGFEPFPKESKHFLLNISVYQYFTTELAAFIGAKGDIYHILRDLTIKNTFVEYDPIRKVYDIHAIFANYLAHQMEQMPKVFRQQAYKKAAQWYLKEGEHLLAMKSAYLAGDFDILLQALANDKGKMINGEHRAMLIKYFEACPIECKKNNLVAVLMYARHMFTFNEIDFFIKSCNEFLSIIQQAEIGNEDEKNRLLAEYELLMCITEYNNIEKIMLYVQRACVLLKDTSLIFNDNSPYTFGSPSVLYLYYRTSGALLKVVHQLEEGLPIYCRVTGNHGIGADEVMKAERFYYMGDFQNAEISMYKAAQLVATETSGVLLCILFLNIKLSFIKGDFQDVRKLFGKLRDVYKIKQYVFVQTIDLCEAYIYALLHRCEKIQPWIQNGEFANTRIFAPAIGFIHMVYGRVLIEKGEYLKLIGMSEQFLNTASFYPNALGKIYTHIYVAQACWQINRCEEAVDVIKKALTIAIPDKVYMPFVENYEYLKQILENASVQEDYEKAISKMILLFKSFQKGMNKMMKDYLPEKVPILTQREKEIAVLAAQGLSNKEICKQLYISENTVKTQLKSIYSKLNITSRTLLPQKLNK